MSFPLPEHALSTLSHDLEINGELKLKNEVHLYGKFRGKIFCEPQAIFVIHSNAFFEGEIHGGRVEVFGSAQGSFLKNEALVLHPGCKVLGQLQGQAIQIEPGAFFQGEIRSSIY